MKRTLFLLAFGLLTCASLQSQPNHFLRANTNAGTEYYLSFPAAWPVQGNKNNIKIYISCEIETDVIVEVKSDGFYKQVKTIPNDIIEVIIPPITAQPFFKTDTQPTPADGIYPGKAIHILASAPITCYGMTLYKQTSDGYLGIPVSGLGKEYIIASAADIADNTSSYLPSETVIAAPYDNTKVTFTLGGNSFTKTNGGGKGINGLTPGQSKSWALMKGDVLSISSFGNSADLSGSKVVATKPVAVISGNYCTYIPPETPSCNFISEQELPMNTWGTVYHVTQIFGRQNNSFVNIFAKYPNTRVYRDGQLIGVIKDVGGTEGYGFINRRVADGPAGNFIISSDSDKPISVTQYNPGQQDDNMPVDPFQMILSPVEEFQTEITFNLPGLSTGSFPASCVNLVYELDANGQIPEDMEFGQATSGEYIWQPLRKLFNPFIGGIFSKPVKDVQYATKTIQFQKNGVYKIRAKKPFVAYAYSLSPENSYGFPTTVAVGDLTTDDKDTPQPTFTLNCDGSVENGFVEDLPKTISQRSNLAQIVLDPVESTNYQLGYDEFIAGDAATGKWKLHVINPTKKAKAVVRFIDRAGNAMDTSITYTPFDVRILDNPTDFGNVKLNSPAVARTITVQNNSTEDSVTIKKLFLKGGATGFVFDPPVDLAANPLVLTKKGTPDNSKTFTITFTATNPGNKPFLDSIIVADDCRQSANLVTATVVKPSITTEDYDFGAHPLHSTTYKTLKITNPGTADLSISGVSGPADPAYTLMPLDFSAMTLEPGEAKTFEVIFKPTEIRAYPDQIVFTSDAAGPDNVVMLNGQGITDVGVPENSSAAPSFSISPNPTHKEAILSYQLGAPALVRVSVFSVLGEEIFTYTSEQQAGEQRIPLHVENMSAGLYFCHIRVGATASVVPILVQ